jgi:putative ABC transport system ATP-binding protein
VSAPTLPGLRWLLPGAAAIELRGIGLRHRGPPPVTALNQVDLVAARGELIVVNGPAGSGKTTLLNVLGLLDRPTTGLYRLDGVDTASLSERERTAIRGRQIGFVFRQHRLLPARSTIDNVALPLLYRGMRRRRRLLIAAGLLERAGLADRAGVAAGQLSDAEQQLVVVARALAGRPSLLLCDEPTAGLDPASTAQVIDLLIGLHQDGGTLAVVTSEPLLTALGTQAVTLGASQFADRTLRYGR